MIYKKNAIIFGSNFGLNTHFKCLYKRFNNKNLFVCSPNIIKKKINIPAFKDFKLAINKYKFDTVCIATPPKIQNKIIKHFLKKKRLPDYMMLEKPLTQNFKETLKILNILHKRKINFYLNFIFVNIDAFKYFKNLIQRKTIKKVIYNWSFRQAYFENKINTWKINSNEGGGLINYYAIHIFFNLLFFFKKVKIIKLIKNNNKCIFSECKILGLINGKIKLEINININSSNKKHSVEIETFKYNYKLININKDWVNGFKILINNKKIKKSFFKSNRKKLTDISYKDLFNNKTKREKNNINSKLAHKLCHDALKINV